MTDQSLTGLSGRSLRPAVVGTLSAADVGARGSYQLPGRSPAAGIVNFSSNGVFNLPRYYPTYQRFASEDNDDDVDDIGSTWRSGEHQRTIPFYRNHPVDDDERNEPIYSKPKASRRSAGDESLPREQFTVALGTDLDTPSRRRRTCCRSRKPCCADCRCRCWSCGWRCCRKPTCRPICVCTIVALILLTFAVVAVAVFLAVFLVLSHPGRTSYTNYSRT